MDGPTQPAAADNGRISRILEQVKSGEIDKSDALRELSSVLNSSVLKRVADGQQITQEGPRFSHEDRRNLINQLMQRNKQEGGIYDDDEYPASPGSSSISGATRSLGGGGHSRKSGGRLSNQCDGRADMGDGLPPPSYSLDNESMYEEDYPQYGGGGNDNDIFPGDARTNRMVRQEASIREDMFKECTFRPKIKDLPSSYGVGRAETGRVGPFYDRVMRWSAEKDRSVSIKKQQVDRSNSTDCTFQPRMNTKSVKAVNSTRTERFDGNIPAGERLYRNSETVYNNRARIIEEELRRERTQEDQQCTFRPDLATKGQYRQVKPKFHLQQRKPDPFVADERRTENCTFTPKVKGVSKNMTSAQLYLSSNVVDRLTRAGGTPDDSPAIDAGTFMQSQPRRSNQLFDSPSTTTPRGRGQFAGTGDRRRASSAPRGGTRATSTNARRSANDDQLTPAELHEHNQRLKEFLGRQQKSTLRYQRHLEEMKTNSTPTFRPELCRKSLEMSEQHFKGEFLDRVERDVLRRTDSEHKAVTAKDYMCTFQPQVSKKVENMKGRSVYEMSRGDSLRRETSRRMMKMRVEREEHEELTFQPEISDVGRRVQSSLKLKEDPAFFLQHYKGLEHGKARRREVEQQHRVQQELVECTFTPQTRDCPGYVKRIARSMHQLKANRSMDDASMSTISPSKPNFKF